ncbi:MAG: NFACT RNA binding domain-containing protein [Candidatus Kryptoniota bacterium]
MLNNYFTLAALLKEKREAIEDSRIVAAYSRIENTLSIVLEKSDHDPNTLIISCKPRANYLFLDDKMHGRLTGANVLPEIIGAKIISTHVEDGERIVVLNISGRRDREEDVSRDGTEPTNLLRINLFGTHANVYLSDNTGRTIDSFLRSKTENPAAATRSLGKRLFPENSDEFVSRWKAEKGNPLQKLSKIIPSFTGKLSKEAFYRLGGKGVTFAVSEESGLDNDQLVELFHVVSEIRLELAEPHPRIYFKDDGPILMSLIELKHLDLYKEKFYESVNSCISAFVSAAHRWSSELELKNTVVNRLLKRKKEVQGTISKIEQDLSKNREEQYRSFGGILMQHLHDIKKGASSFSLGGVIEAGEIPLDSKLSAVKNAQQYFEKSKKARESHRLAITRMEELKKSLVKIEDELRNVEGETDHKKLLSIEKKKKTKDDVPFRQFEIKGYKVYVGKDAKNNDKLTFGFAKPNDIFLHARGVSGSHVIIRNPSHEFPQKPVLQFAASLAAHYSKARTSGIVPVAYTMRKFVKKAKGEPGAVLLDREEVIFVKPGIPIGIF